MAYYTGYANSFADLRQALVDHLSGHGWSWDGGNNDLVNGSAIINLTTTATNLNARGRITSGSDTGGSSLCRMGVFGTADFVWPALYYLFVFNSPDEVYLIVNHSVDVYQWLAFGRSTIPVPGSGTFLGATLAQSTGSGLDISTSGFTSYSNNPSLFGGTHGSSAQQPSFVDHRLQGAYSPWDLCTGYGGTYDTAGWLVPSYTQPNAWNSEAVLLPLRAWCALDGYKIACVAETKNARHIRNDYYEPGQILTLGSDRWMVFPWYRKNITNRNGGASSGATAHSGTFGWAIRFDEV